MIAVGIPAVAATAGNTPQAALVQSSTAASRDTTGKGAFDDDDPDWEDSDDYFPDWEAYDANAADGEEDPDGEANYNENAADGDSGDEDSDWEDSVVEDPDGEESDQGEKPVKTVGKKLVGLESAAAEYYSGEK